MKKYVKHPDLSVLPAGALIVLFCYTALAKLMHLAEFEKQLRNQVLPDWSKGVLTGLIPGSELLLCIALAIPATRLVGILWLSSINGLIYGLYRPGSYRVF